MNALQWAGLVGLCVGVGITWHDWWTARTERHLRRLVADCCQRAREHEDADIEALMRATQDVDLWQDFERTQR